MITAASSNGVNFTYFSDVFLGRNSNGRIDWKDMEGRSLKECELMEENMTKQQIQRDF